MKQAMASSRKRKIFSFKNRDESSGMGATVCMGKALSPTETNSGIKPYTLFGAWYPSILQKSRRYDI
jgi:hypothetical protein